MSKRRKKKLPEEPVLATIESLSHDGRGIAHINGKITFIRNALPNETVLFKYTNQRGKFDEGEAIEIQVASNDRVEPICKHYAMCGGCSLQHLNSDAQIALKQQTLLDQLKHIGNVKPKTILPPLRSQTAGYRQKARLGVRYVTKKEALLIGFREKNGRYITEIESCPVLHESIGQKIMALRTLIRELSQYQQIPQIEVAIGDNQTALVIRHLNPLSDEDLAQLKQFAKTAQIDIYLQPGNVETVHKLWPEDSNDWLHYELNDHGAQFHFHPCDFTQINRDINIQMVNRAAELLQLTPEDRVLDLFCGLGNFTIPLAKQCQTITGIEGDERMVKRAAENALLNKLNNTKFYAANLTEDISNTPWAKTTYDKVILDPPRSGALDVIKFFPKLNASRIVYASCNPATLARDVGELVHQQGYRLLQAGVMDMFPHTAHVESIAVLTYGT